MRKPIVSHEYAVKALESARQATDVFCDQHNLRYDYWENSLPKGTGVRQLRLRILSWGNQLTPQHVADWQKLVLPLLQPGFKLYGSRHNGLYVRGNAIQYYYVPDGKQWFVNPWVPGIQPNWGLLERMAGKPFTGRGYISYRSMLTMMHDFLLRLSPDHVAVLYAESLATINDPQRWLSRKQLVIQEYGYIQALTIPMANLLFKHFMYSFRGYGRIQDHV